MKKSILTLALAMAVGSAWAAKAWNMPITVLQPDGTTITVFLHGDEDFCWYTSADGEILERNGNLFSPVSESRDAFFAKAARMKMANKARREAVTGTSSQLFPHVGSPRALVILAEYKDKKFSINDPKKSFDQYLNKADGKPVDFGYHEDRNYGSVRQYFDDMSGGKFTPQFDVVGPVTLPENMQYYGGTSSSGNDERTSDLVVDACELARDSVDFSLYDNNADGYVDLVYVIYAGYGQNMGAANNTIWAKSTYVNTTNTYNGKRLYRCGVNNELLANEQAFNGEPYITGLGVFVHEFSHCLGLPDFYASRLTSSVYDNQGMEDWSVMDNGMYKRNGWIPTAYTAWEREAMGWLDIETVNAPQQLTMTNIDDGGKAYRINNSSNADEYFVIQRIQNKGWNTRLANSENTVDGLMVCHVDYDTQDFSINRNNVNNIAGHPRMSIAPADGILTSSYRYSNGEMTLAEYNAGVMGDLYGNTASSTATSFVQTADIPNSKWWQDGDEIKLYNIHTDEAGVMHVDFNKDFATNIGVVKKNIDDDKVYSVKGVNMGNTLPTLPKGIYIRGGKKTLKR